MSQRRGERGTRAVAPAAAAIAAATLAAAAMADAPEGYFVKVADTVVVEKTKLVWEASPPKAVTNYADAQQRCAAKGAGWRVPTIRELHTIVDEFSYDPALDPKVFSFTSLPVWSSSDPKNGFDNLWYLDTKDGQSWLLHPVNDKAASICVKSMP